MFPTFVISIIWYSYLVCAQMPWIKVELEGKPINVGLAKRWCRCKMLLVLKCQSNFECNILRATIWHRFTKCALLFCELLDIFSISLHPKIGTGVYYLPNNFMLIRKYSKYAIGPKTGTLYTVLQELLNSRRMLFNKLGKGDPQSPFLEEDFV